MKNNQVRKIIPDSARSIVAIFLALTVLMIASAAVELFQSKKEILHIMEEQAHSLLESIIVASHNTLQTTQYLDELAREKILKFEAHDPRFLEFKKKIGFGVLLRTAVAQNPRIIFAALQDTSAILAASGNVSVLQSISSSPFLRKALSDSLFRTRITEFDSTEIFEAVHPFVYDGHTIGLMRIGLSLEPVHMVNSRIYRRLIIITIVLTFIGFFIFIFLFTRQRYFLLKKQYSIVETYSGNIIGNVSDGIIVVDKAAGIKIFNKAAEQIFGKTVGEVQGYSTDVLFEQKSCLKLLQSESVLTPINCKINGQKKYLLISKSKFTDADGLENEILVIRDLTQQKQLEEQMERKQRLTAMGELASGVAHEIRNPLNTISTIIQQLNKDFEPSNEPQEYHQLAGLVYNEVNRINHTIQDFLRFSRPEPIQTSSFNLSAFLKEIKTQFAATLKEQQATLEITEHWKGDVVWDPRQMRQVVINLVQNALQAVPEGSGKINISVNPLVNGELELVIKDNGPGIKKEFIANIFNLYFTTKAKGTGIGLSIVQRIIYEHHGVISVESEEGSGAEFRIKLPITI